MSWVDISAPSRCWVFICLSVLISHLKVDIFRAKKQIIFVLSVRLPHPKDHTLRCYVGLEGPAGHCFITPEKALAACRAR
jgi:hypothetical protein